MSIKVERTEGGNPAEDPALTNRIEEMIKKQILVSGKVEIVNYGTLPRSERKSKRVFDHRNI
jgi:phenylacetate-CoA ligase